MLGSRMYVLRASTLHPVRIQRWGQSTKEPTRRMRPHPKAQSCAAHIRDAVREFHAAIVQKNMALVMFFCSVDLISMFLPRKCGICLLACKSLAARPQARSARQATVTTASQERAFPPKALPLPAVTSISCSSSNLFRRKRSRKICCRSWKAWNLKPTRATVSDSC